MIAQVTLPYATNGLEPVIDQATIETHHGKHHAAYTKAFQELVTKAGLDDLTPEAILGSLDQVADQTLRNGLRNQGGGFYNHNLYFEELAPEIIAKHSPTGNLLDAINAAFGSFDEMVSKLSTAATTQFGSGWAWLNTDAHGKLSISQSGNQDNPISLGSGLTPILALDVWEHAYYLKYRNLRADYVKEFFRIVDWKVIEERYDKRAK